MSRSVGNFRINISKLSYLIVGIVCFLNGIMFGAYFMHKHDASTRPVDTYEKYDQPTISPTTKPVGLSEKVIKDHVEEIKAHIDAPSAPNIALPPATAINPTTTPQPQAELTFLADIPDLYLSSTIMSSESAPSSVLIVGGTDGSGTRRVVQVLTDLGVTMVSEDPETYDIHADSVAGWPVIVKPVLKHTRKLNYQPGDLPQAVHEHTVKSLRKLTDQAAIDATKPQSEKLAVGGALKIKTYAKATGVKYGFKAPVAMTLLPYWTAVLPHVKFLHVLRDGRDISFSANQGPVEKFYGEMYTGKGNWVRDPHVQAIQLWSDWNADIFHWSQSHIKRLNKTKDPDHGYGYLVLHSEDLVSGDKQIRYEAIARMALFVQSDMTAEQICCLAVKDSAFMGSHDRSKNAVVSSRYGKWQQFTKSNKPLLQQMYAKGKDGLKLFGYDPVRSRPKFSKEVPSLLNYQCKKQAEECINPVELKMQQALLQKVRNAKCIAEIGKDYAGGDLSSESIPEELEEAESAVYCCQKCREEGACRYFTVSHAQHLCFLKSQMNSVKINENLISAAIMTNY